MSSPLPCWRTPRAGYTKCRNDGSDDAFSGVQDRLPGWQRNANDRMQPEIVALWGPTRPSRSCWGSDLPSRELVRRGRGSGCSPAGSGLLILEAGRIVKASRRFPSARSATHRDDPAGASAGTGKTYTIAALATCYIAQGTATIDQMLMITFGRSATGNCGSASAGPDERT